MATNITLICVLLVISAFFSSCEMAFSTVNRIKLKAQISQPGDPSRQKRARTALSVVDNFDKALTTILVGNNVVNTASAALGTVIFTELFGASGLGIATACMTVAVLIFGEILPKSIAKENPENFTIVFGGLLSILIWLLTPVTWLFSQIKRFVSSLINSSGSSTSVTEDELKFLIDESEEQGILEEEESNLVKSALEFDDIEVSRILIPRVNVVAVEEGMSLQEVQNVFIEEQYTRVPVYEKTIDSIIGIINEKDFFKLVVGQPAPTDKQLSLKEIISPAMYISERRLISEVLMEMQRAKTHMAIVMDQYGGTQGIVTMEDIIEELVGEIYDENDEVISRITHLDDYTVELDPSISIEDFLDELSLPEGMIQTERTSIGGWVMELIGKIPQPDETITASPFTITVLSMEKQKLERVRMSILPSVIDELKELEASSKHPESEKTDDKQIASDKQRKDDH